MGILRICRGSSVPVPTLQRDSATTGGFPLLIIYADPDLQTTSERARADKIYVNGTKIKSEDNDT